MVVKMAWRNLWRNRRRTFLTLSSIAFAVLIAVVMRGFQLGSYDVMIGGTLKSTSGFVQIQHKDFWDDKTIDNIIDFTPELAQTIESVPEVIDYFERFQNFALASNGQFTKGVPVFGILPEKEKRATAIHEKLIQGDYLSKGDHSVLISKELARYLVAEVNDSIVLFGQGYHGVTAVGKYRVKGIFDYSTSQIGNSVVYLNLVDAQELYGAFGMVTSISLNLENRDLADRVQGQLQTQFEGSELTAMHWKDLNESLLQNIELDNVSGQIMIGVLYLVIGFGIFGTLLMMAAERKREFSVMNSIGMRRSKIIRLVIVETLFLALLAVVVGMILSLPINAYFYFNPIYFEGEVAEMYAEYNIEPVMKMSLGPGYIYTQAIIVFLMSTVSMLGPLKLIKNMNVVNALRGR